MEQRFDFAEDNAHTGFRLAHFEWYNWGTYDREIFSLDMQRENALLTGDIGSGKSTVVDALTTLLVPHNRIVYNKAAGAESRERSLYSYIVGEYKSLKDDTYGTAKAASLRDPAKSFTVLLARFENEGYDETMTLAQFFWIGSDGKPQKFFVTSRGALGIERDFFDFGDVRELKKRLRRLPHTAVYDTFREYGADFRRVMGIRSEQALNLFYQTVSLKSIGNLTEFIRHHMLEAGEIDAQVDAVCHNFAELNRAHNLILEAQRQIELLTPVDQAYRRYEQDSTERERIAAMRGALEAWYADRRISLIEQRIAAQRLEEEKVDSRKRSAEAESERLFKEIAKIEIELHNNGADRLKQLGDEIERSEESMALRQKEKSRYDALTKALSFPTVSNEHRFLKTREEAAERIEEAEKRAEHLQNEKVLNAVTLTRYTERSGELEGEIAYLQRRRSNIPQRTAQIRDAMAEALGLDAEALPFAGELIRVEDADWEGAIERVLHGFALSLIVDAAHYDAVSDYVERTHLGGKLVYLKVDTKRDEALYEPPQADSLLHKIEVKADSPFAAVLHTLLRERFDLPCVEDIDTFRRLKRALTIHGQFKSSLMRHEKDDRHRIDDRSRWVLGWSNREKLALLQEQLEELMHKRNLVEKENEEIAMTLTKVAGERDGLRDLLAFETYETIDWYALSHRIEALQREKRELEESSDLLKTLQSQLENSEKLRREVMERIDSLGRQLGQLEAKIERDEEDRKRALSIVEDCETLESQSEEIGHYVAGIETEEPTLTTISAQASRVRESMTQEIDRLDKRIGRAREKMVTQMQAFINAFPVVAKEFDASVESAGEFRKKLAELKRDDLPRWRKRFKQLLKEKMVQHIIVLQNTLDRQSGEIVEKIEHINRSLRDIEYSEGSYIELIAEPVRDMRIREFKESLKSAVSGAIGEDNSYDEQKFLQIKEIIERFNGREGHSDEDRHWRKLVTDVRNWFAFSAAEKYLSDGSLKEYYTDSGGKSGGQKEKLAYTVLASSLAFQFGLEHDRIKSRSFRFVMIDEAFGRGSDESTRYALRLFEKLDLQLLVITPKQKINVIEPFVESVHFVHNREGMESSIVSMRIEDFREKRAEAEKMMNDE